MGVRLTWQDNSSTEDGFRIYRSTAPIDIVTPPNPLASVLADTTTYDDESAVDNEIYYYRVAAIRDGLVSFSEELMFTAAPPAGDPHWASVSLLLTGDGTDGSTAIIDASSNGFVMTPHGNAKIGVAHVPFGDSSITLDGVGDYITTPHSSAFAFGSSDFTIEGWFRVEFSASACELFAKDAGAPNYTSIGVVVQTNQGMSILGSSSGADHELVASSAAGAVPLNTWTHIAVVRSGPTFFGFVGGIKKVEQTFAPALAGQSSAPFIVGSRGAGWNALKGQLKDFRVTKGVARYTANFTIEQIPFPRN